MPSNIDDKKRIEPDLYRPNYLTMKAITRIKKELKLPITLPLPPEWADVQGGPSVPTEGLIPLALIHRLLFCLSQEGHLWAYILDKDESFKNLYYRDEFEIEQTLTDFFQESHIKVMLPWEQLAPIYKKCGCYFQYSSINKQPLYTKAYIAAIDTYFSLIRSRYSSIDRLAYLVNKYRKGEKLTHPPIMPDTPDKKSWALPPVLSPEDITGAIFCKDDTFHDAKNTGNDIMNLYNTKLMNLYLKTNRRDEPVYESIIAAYAALKNSQWNKENITESMDVAKINPKTLRIITSMKNIRYERSPDNTKKNTFDFIRLHMGLCTKKAVPDRNQHIQTHGQEFASLALSRIADSKRFKTSGLPVGFLKLEKMCITLQDELEILFSVRSI